MGCGRPSLADGTASHTSSDTVVARIVQVADERRHRPGVNIVAITMSA
jgi:hypothetical protein